MKIWIQYAWKELKNNSRFCLFFVLNLSLGLVGFIALNSFNDSLKLHLEENLKNILTGDFAVFSNRPLKEEETKIIYKTIGKEYEESRQIIFFSMIAGKKQARLAQIVAIDSKFPLYGNFSLNGKQKVIPKLIQENLQKKPSVWMYPEVRTTLGSQLQDTIKIGLKRFSISKEIHEDPSGALSNMGLAPKIYIGLSQVKDTGLIQKGSRVSYVRFFKIPSHVDAEKLTKVLREKFKKKYGRTSDVSVRSHKDASRRLSQLLDYVTGYLGLIAIIALFLAGIGAAYLFRGYLQNRIQDMAILMSLGASKKESYTVLFIQLIILGAGSAILAILISALLIPYTPQVLQGIMPSNFIAKINISSLFLAFGLGSLGSIIFCLPVMVRINQMKPSQLFQEASQPVQQINNGKFQTFLSYLPALLAFWGLAVWQSQSLKEGTTFIILFLGALFILGFIGWGILSLCGKLSNRQHVIVGMAFRNLHRHRMAAISCFLAISLGAFLINLIPQLHQGLQKEIERPNGLTIPSFFLFDIQPEQVQAIRKFLKQEGYHLANLSPMVRARLEKINNRSLKIKPTNAQRQRNLEERRLRRRGFNLSYRKSLSSSEGITKGKPLATTYNLDSNKPAEISVEERFAKRFKLKLGDTLSFDVQGISIQGKIVNFRSVRWNSFQPNFFILFQT
ncbi:MAG: putative ABC transport system permease protein, partial [bacterium]